MEWCRPVSVIVPRAHFIDTSESNMSHEEQCEIVILRLIYPLSQGCCEDETEKERTVLWGPELHAGRGEETPHPANQ